MIHSGIFLVMVVDVVESFIPTRNSLLLEDENLFAKATPKAALIATTDSAVLDVLLYECITRHFVPIFEMLFKRRPCIKYLGADPIFLQWFNDLTAEHLDLEML